MIGWLLSCAQAAPVDDIVCVEGIHFEDGSGLIAEAEVADLTDPLIGQAQKPSIHGQVKLSVDSDYVEWNLKLKSAVFKGNVVASRNDVTIHSEALTVRLDDANQIKEALAEGRVVITAGDRKAYSERAQLDVVEGTLHLSESPRVETPKGLFLGDTLLIWLDDDRVKCDGQCRVEVTED
ncbi:MAG: LptA/OstA family protein [Myxococcota bacterium]